MLDQVLDIVTGRNYVREAVFSQERAGALRPGRLSSATIMNHRVLS